ncbi:HAD-IA family hydrolase [Lactiplantibacillus herbarum]|uniref:HAD-IA family hydrolase n=1 Tax=Lactiplantibacillus herbarum TaxID=1670446 RepID=UPI00064FFE7C|nr:HAD-IA family hydrolase [Lactiplantibacillus herbarum]
MINKNIKIVAFDFFDTLVHRYCHPEVNLYKWSKEISCSLDYVIDAKTVYTVRKQAEQLLKKNIEESSYRDLISLLFEKISAEVELPIDLENFQVLCKSLEMDIELESLYFNGDVKYILEEAVKKNKKIIVISDFYFDSTLMWAALKKFKVDHYFSQVYVSSEIGVRKSTGNLFKKVISINSIDPSELMMIGDNRISDYKVPGALGIKCIPLVFNEKHVKNADSKSIKLALEKVSFIDEVKAPFNGYLPAVYLFIEKLYKNLVKAEIHEISFCSREGQLMRTLFEAYQEKNHVGRKIKTHYFYTSRKATLSASLKELKSEKFESVFQQYQQLYLGDFLSSLSFTETEKEMLYSESKLNEKSIVKPMAEDSCLNELFDVSEFKKLYDLKRTVQKKLLQKYILSLCNLNDNQFVIADIGWKGTMQDNLDTIMKDMDIVGYYLGLNIEKNHNEKNKYGLLFEKKLLKSNFYEVFSKDYMIYERIFVADHGPVDGYKLDNTAKVEPVIYNNNDELALYNYTKPYQNQFIKGFDELLSIFNCSIYSDKELEFIVAKLTLKQDCIQYPKIWEVEYSQRVKAKENFGDLSGSLKKDRQAVRRKRLEKRQFLFVDYTYKLPQKLFKTHLFDWLSACYCHLVYVYKLLGLEVKKGRIV